MKCKFCQSQSTVKIGKRDGKQRYKCKDCGKRFVDNGKLPRMRTKIEVIAFGVDLYFEGMSVRKVQRQIKNVFGVKASQATIHNWITKYSQLVSEYLSNYKLDLGNEWHVDETVIKVKGESTWFWEIIDKKTRFMVAEHLSDTRTVKDCTKFFNEANERARNKPERVVSDGCFAYKRSFNKIFYDHHQSCKLIQNIGINGKNESDYNQNIVERLHGTLKDILSAKRGMDNKEMTESMLKGWWVHYNFVRPHSTLKGKTPAEVAGCELKIDGWRDLIEMASKYNDSSEYTVTNKVDCGIEATTEA